MPALDLSPPLIGALAALLLCQLTGELPAHVLGLPAPGPVLGMLLIFNALFLRRREEPLQRVADGLIGHLGLLFVPAGVGVVLSLPQLARDWAPVTLAILAGALAPIAATGRLAEWLLRRFGRGEDPPPP